MLLKACSLDIENTSITTQRASALLIVFLAFIFAYFLDGNFAYVCGLIGSCATVFDSIILPVLFYSVVHQYYNHHNHDDDHQQPQPQQQYRYSGLFWLHGLILVIAVSSACAGIYSNLSHVI